MEEVGVGGGHRVHCLETPEVSWDTWNVKGLCSQYKEPEGAKDRMARPESLGELTCKRVTIRHQLFWTGVL